MEVDSSHVTIGNNTVMHNMTISMNSGYEQRLEIMDNNTFWGGKIILRDSTHLKICKESIFAAGLSMWTCDAHTIFDLDTKEVLNENPDMLEIGEHCWVGADTHFLKKGSIARDTVVAMSSVITKPFTEPNTVIGGYPAKVLRRNIGWSRHTIWNYKKIFLNETKGEKNVRSNYKRNEKSK